MTEQNQSVGFYLKKMFSASIAMSAVNATEKIVAFALLPILTAYLSPKDYGIISLFQVTISFLGMIYNPGTLSSTVRLYYDYDKLEDTKVLFGSTLLFFLVIPISFIFLSLFIGEYVFNLVFDDFEFWPYGFLALCAALLVQPKRLWSQFSVIQYKVERVAFWTIISFITGVLSSLLLVIVFKLEAFGRILGVISGNLIIFIVGVVTLIKFTKLRFSGPVFKNTFSLGLPITIGVWSYVIMDISSRFIISKHLSLEDLGLFDVGYKISSLPLLISLGFKQVWNPIFFENMKNKNYSNISKLTVYFVLVFSTACGGFILFGKEITELLVDSRFHNAFKIIPLVTLSVYFLSLVSVFSSMLSYEKKFLTGGSIAFVAAVLNVGFNLIFVPIFNIVGAALAISLANLVYLSIILYISRSSLKRISDKKKLLISNLFLIASFALVYTSFNFFMVKVVLVIVWSIFVLKSNLIINQNEKQKAMLILKQFIGKKLNRIKK